MFYVKPSDQFESIVFHDADTLDFMGTIGITLLLAIVGIEDWTPDLKNAINLIKQFCNDLPQKLITNTTKIIGQKRKVEMETFLKNLSLETKDYTLI